MTGSTSDSETRPPIEHLVPKDSTVKQLYATAYRCAKPDCQEPLYRMNNDTGEWILNSTVAHIHARRENGPRWDPDMSEAENRDAANLLLLCQPHSFEIDATPGHFPPDLLRQWKQAQLDEHASLGKQWTINDAEVAEVIAVSFHRAGMATAGAGALLDAARAVSRLTSAARDLRQQPAAAARAWQQLRRQVRQSFVAWDSVTGEHVYAEPSNYETQQHHQALIAALTTVVEALRPLAREVGAHVHAIRVANPEHAPWCDWTDRVVGSVLEASARWPGPPPADDDTVLPEAITELDRAFTALGARCRGENAEPAPPPPAPEPEPTETEAQRRYREHKELLDTARPWDRVETRPYDADLYTRLLDDAEYAVGIPWVGSYLGYWLDDVARLAAKVARNADDNAFHEIITTTAARTPLAVSVTILRELVAITQAGERASLEAECLRHITDLLAGAEWHDPNTWFNNGFHARALLNWTASITSNDAVQAKITVVLEENPELLPHILHGIAQWLEQRDSYDMTTVTKIFETLDALPAWLPTDALIVQINRQLPDLTPAEDSDRYVSDDSTRRLAAHVLRLARPE